MFQVPDEFLSMQGATLCSPANAGFSGIYVLIPYRQTSLFLLQPIHRPISSILHWQPTPFRRGTTVVDCGLRVLTTNIYYLRTLPWWQSLQPKTLFLTIYTQQVARLLINI